MTDSTSKEQAARREHERAEGRREREAQEEREARRAADRVAERRAETDAPVTPSSAPEPAEDRPEGDLLPWGPEGRDVTATSPHGFATSSIAGHQAAYDADVARRARPAKMEARPIPKSGAPEVNPNHPTMDEVRASEAYQCATPWTRDTLGFIIEGPLDFTPDNLGLKVHDFNNLAIEYAWTPDARVPDGHYVRAGDLYPPEMRRRILKKEDVGT